MTLVNEIRRYLYTKPKDFEFTIYTFAEEFKKTPAQIRNTFNTMIPRNEIVQVSYIPKKIGGWIHVYRIGVLYPMREMKMKYKKNPNPWVAIYPDLKIVEIKPHMFPKGKYKFIQSRYAE